MRPEIDLRGFLSRLLGWNNAPAVDRALRSVELAAGHVPLVLCGDGDLVSVAHALHRRILGTGRPFVVGDPRRGNTPASVRAPANYVSGVAAFGAATEGTVCVRSKRPPLDFAEMVELLRDPGAPHVQLVVCAGRYQRSNVLLAISAPIQVPSLGARARDLPRIVEEYGADACAALSSSAAFTPRDRDWVCERCASSLQEIEAATTRLVALRHAGSAARAAELLGISHGSLSEWFARRRSMTRSARGGGGRRGSRPAAGPGGGDD